MLFADFKTVKKLREQFPVGCRVVLDEMDDPYTKIPVGTQGVCRGVDDAGNIMVRWDCGSSLSVVYEADRCHCVATEAEIKVSLEHWHKANGKPTRCPRCGAEPTTYEHEILAISRRANITGTSTKKRAGFKLMVQDALAGKIDLILVKSISRFARNTIDSLQTIKLLRDKGVEVFFEKENLWTLDTNTDFMLTIMSSMAQEESHSISQNTTLGKRNGFALGKATLS